MSIADEFNKGAQIGEKYGKFSTLGDAIRGTLDRVKENEGMQNLYATKYGMERAFQDPVEREYKQEQLKNLRSEQALRDQQIQALGNFGKSTPGGDPFKQFGISQEESKYYYPPQPKYTSVSGVPVVSGYEEPKVTEEGKIYFGQKMEEGKPLSGEGAVKYQSAVRAIDSIKNINNSLGKYENIKQTKDAVYKANQYINAATAKETFIPGLQGAYSSNLKEKAGDTGAEIGNYFLNLAESLLRAESGAAVTDSEMLRTKARSLFDAWRTPKVWKTQQRSSLDFAKGIAKNIRPLSKAEWGYDLPEEQTTLPEGYDPSEWEAI